ncbi:TadE family protein [Streptomyces tsukubensis]|uniref:Pilus assembly protein TadE n=1 Tax=Streptomyces tsukubensis TaxID=83656 RepID=A0A1V4ADL2_9ACTN|nr:TadE family protein [Streptomyces tsukubensis]OON81497.1 pilus assembly protein TadE [Streptomyces tsukubensis]
MRAFDRRARAPRGRAPRGDRGSSILEFTGFLPVMLLIGMAAIQLGLVGYAVNQAGTGARAAARAASQRDGDGNAAGHAAMSGWINADVSAPGPGGDTTTAKVTVKVPTLVPFVNGWEVSRSATMPTDD